MFRIIRSLEDSVKFTYFLILCEFPSTVLIIYLCFSSFRNQSCFLQSSLKLFLELMMLDVQCSVICRVNVYFLKLV